MNKWVNKNKLILLSNSPPTHSQNKYGKNLGGNFTVEEIVSLVTN